jgi:hypothetical protein
MQLCPAKLSCAPPKTCCVDSAQFGIVCTPQSEVPQLAIRPQPSSCLPQPLQVLT